MIFIIYALGLLLLAAIPAALVYRNLNYFQVASRAPSEDATVGVSILIPARNEESGIRAAIDASLASAWPHFEVVVMDDHSTDRTPQIVEELKVGNDRLRLEHSAVLPEGWNGKQHACWQLSQVAQFDLLLFVDADVRLQPDALRRLVSELKAADVDLLSGFPQQQTVGLLEQLLIPMMYVVLLGYLPLDRMRASPDPAFGAGCGQLFLARKDAYSSCGGHQAIRSSRHDGLKLPRAFRSAGFMTDLFDASDIASVRMYNTPGEVIRGLLKNADEGIANAKLIFVFSFLLLGSAVLPILSLPHAVYYGWPPIAIGILVVATLLSFLPRWMIARRLNHPWLSVLLHPITVALFVGLQWVAFLRRILGLKEIAWRGRH